MIKNSNNNNINNYSTNVLPYNIKQNYYDCDLRKNSKNNINIISLNENN